ncbi:MAG: SanA/YdcF family protein [Anaerolineae bacterium]
MRAHWIVHLLMALLLMVLGGVGLIVVLRGWTNYRSAADTFTVDTVPVRGVAVVFGAGVWPGGRLSAILEDRVYTAAALYHAGKVSKLLMTGDNRTLDYNEPGHMRAYALELGVPDKDIVLDYAGRRTYDSCYRAVHIFKVDTAILVTQSYHMDRALFIARGLGLDAVGVVADRRDYVHIRHYWWREMLATALAAVEVYVTHPVPVLGEELPIWDQR